jgi:hypothetical protein
MEAVSSIVVVDTETTDLDLDVAFAVEVAWWNLNTGERGCFIPPHDVDWVLEHASPTALEVNGYRERLQHAKQGDKNDITELYVALAGATVAGANVGSLDWPILRKLWTLSDPWSYRPLEIGSYAAALNGQAQPMGMRDVYSWLGLPDGDHTAAGDVEAEGQALLALFAKAGATL